MTSYHFFHLILDCHSVILKWYTGYHNQHRWLESFFIDKDYFELHFIHLLRHQLGKYLHKQTISIEHVYVYILSNIQFHYFCRTMHWKLFINTISRTFLQEQHALSLMKIMLSGDVELNPGPTSVNNNDQEIVYANMSRSNMILTQRLFQIGLRPFDVGGGGDCFFKSVAHQLYGDSVYHQFVRDAGVRYLIQHQERFSRFIEGNEQFSWLTYLNNMSRLGTWCDNIIVQAVSDALNITINIAESIETFSPYTVISPCEIFPWMTSIFIGHIDETHYVSTIPAVSLSLSKRNSPISETVNNQKVQSVAAASVASKRGIEECDNSMSSGFEIIESKRQNRKDYMRNYREKMKQKQSFEMNNIPPTTFEDENVLKARKNETNTIPSSGPDIGIEESKIKTCDEDDKKYKREASKMSKQSFKERHPDRFKRMNKRNKKQSKERDIEHYRHVCKKQKQSFKKKDPTRFKNICKKNMKSYIERDPKHYKEICQKGFQSYKDRDPEHYKEICQKKYQSYKERDPEHYKEICQKKAQSYKKRDPEHYKEICQKNVQSYKKRDPEHFKCVEKRKNQSFKARNRDHHKTVSRRNRLSFKKRNVDSNKAICNDHMHVSSNNRSQSNENLENDVTTKNTNVSDIIDNFHEAIKEGPEFVCTCCDQLWYRSSVLECKADSYNFELFEDKPSTLFITDTKSVENKKWICRTCHNNLKNGKVPTCSKANGMSFPEKPAVLNLTPLEERLIAPRIPFMQIRELPRGHQLSIHGNVVNVPADVNTTISMIPRPIDESQTISIKLKKRKGFKGYYMFQTIRPFNVMYAAHYLTQTSELYRDEGIQLSNEWLNGLPLGNDDEMGNVSYCDDNDMIPNDNISTDHDQSGVDINENDIDSDDEWNEIEERPAGNTDTLLEPADINHWADKLLTVAPGEGNRPLGIFHDKDSEFLAFPSIFCGKRRCESEDRLVRVHYSDICKWELRSVDRRVAQSVPNIFYKLKKLQIKTIQDTAMISVRKCKKKGKAYKAKDFKSEESINNIINLDEGFRVFKNLRGSPPYFEKCKKDLFAMIRQLGYPAWFCSFSAADTRWVHLLKLLGKLVENITYTVEDVKNMSWEKKSELIQKDPVTCARHFDHMVQLFFNKVLKSEAHPIGEIVDFFYRTEFQQRGSPHIHVLFWVKDAPDCRSASNEEITKFVDKYVCCEKHIDDDLDEFVSYQEHKHSKTCRKRHEKVCRFNFPLAPMPETMILEPPNDDELTDHELKVAKTNSKKIKDSLDLMKYGEDITFIEFLQKLDMSLTEYIVAIRSDLKRRTILLKRSPAAIRVNSYNVSLLKAWQANMDIQFILDPYACAMYVLSYILKGQKGMSKLLERACKEAKLGNKDIKNKIRHIGNKFLNAVEVSAQEAVYLVLQMPLRRSSREFQFVNTSHMDDRAFLVRSQEQINELPDDSEDIECDNLIKRYQRRPKALENVCLADFAAWYNYVRDKKANVEKTNLYDENTEDDVINDLDEIQQKEYPVKGGMKFVKRKKAKIIRSVRYNEDHDPENYYREQLMLYTTWRNENKLAQGYDSYENKYDALKEDIVSKRKQYEGVACDLDNAIESFEGDTDDIGCSIAPGAQHSNEIDAGIGSNLSEFYGCFHPGAETLHSRYDMLNDVGIFARTQDDEIQQVHRLGDTEYRSLARSLNKEQKEFFYHVLHCVKTSNRTLSLFLSGGAGVGKSRVTNALYEALIRFYDHQVGANPDEIKVLKMAPTGKAAYNIGGNTIHSALKVPANRGFAYYALDTDRLNTLRCQLGKLKLILIDEISMVGAGMLHFINLRLQQIMGNNALFGGISIIAVGDLFQLQPVFDKWIFESTSSNVYSALASNLWQDNFTMYELIEIMRQREDKDFAEILNRVREGKHSNEDLNVIKTRLVSLNANAQPTLDETHLFTTNKAVDLHNKAVYDKCSQPKAEVKAIDIVIGDISDELKRTMLSKISDDASKTMGLSSVIKVAVSLKYDISTNIAVLDGMSNGVECTIQNIDYRVPGSERPSIIWVLFSNEHIGRDHRREHRFLYESNIDLTWTPILEITRQFSVSRRSHIHVLRRQFPLRPAAAKTIHRSQGDTVDQLVVDFPSNTREHMHYVGLSRVTKLANLKISNLNEDKMAASEKVKSEMKRLREEAKVQLCISPLYKIQHSNSIKIVYQNVRSLHLHIEDVAADYNIQACDVINIAETALVVNDLSETYQLPDFNLYRNDHVSSNNQRTPYGLAVYVKQVIPCTVFAFNCNGVEISVTRLHDHLQNLHIISIYRSKLRASILQLVEAMDQVHNFVLSDGDHPIIILGDFNVNLLEPSAEQNHLSSYVRDHRGYTQLINKYTTDYCTQIDHIYTNVPQLVSSSGVLESYYSDHKPIYVCFRIEMQVIN